MTINEAITQVLSASHHGDQHFRKFLLGDDPEVVAMRQALVQLADAVRCESVVITLGTLVDAFEQLPADIVTDPAMEELRSLISQVSRNLESA